MYLYSFKEFRQNMTSNNNSVTLYDDILLFLDLSPTRYISDLDDFFFKKLVRSSDPL